MSLRESLDELLDRLRECYASLDELNDALDAEVRELERRGVDFPTITKIESSYIFALKALGDAIMHIERLLTHLKR